MKSRLKKKEPELVIKKGKPVSVILDIDQYEEMLERLEDIDDLKDLEMMRKKPLKFRRFEDFLKERKKGA